jgi:1,4-alpha-glucan branching enzyme
LEAIACLRTMNQEIYREFPDTQTIAEESTAWPMVSRPVHLGGLGFGLKWDMGWMHDTLGYFRTDPFFRRYHHHELTFRGLYAFSENFVLPLSHDEVVYGKGSLLGQMPGDSWQKFANLRLLYGYMYGLPGKKLLFMGGEFGQWREWNHDQSLDWHLLGSPEHEGIQRWVQALNRVHRFEPALHELDCGQGGFEWIDCQDTEKSVLSFLRRSPDPDQTVLVVCSFTPVPRYNYRIGVPLAGFWREILNSDAIDYGGSGHGNFGGLGTVPVAVHGRRYSVTATLPPLGVLFFRFDSRLSGSG